MANRARRLEWQGRPEVECNRWLRSDAIPGKISMWFRIFYDILLKINHHKRNVSMETRNGMDLLPANSIN